MANADAGTSTDRFKLTDGGLDFDVQTPVSQKLLCVVQFCSIDQIIHIPNQAVGLAILKLAKEDTRWSGTMTELKTVLRNRYPLLTEDAYSFPRQENKLSTAIRRIIPPLRRMGVEISFTRIAARACRTDE
ncbi:hypothetical protein ACJ5NV_17275 [Loktanella agnita]|uniref:hypothetical protein n=1 Tax=Loktanella agnita TaxID=287097 RepID=UPI003988F765